MNVHLFGKNDSPCVIKQVAKNKYDNDHIVAKSIDENFYMDDFIKSGNSLEILIHTITNTLSQYSFRLHKWISKNEYLLYTKQNSRIRKDFQKPSKGPTNKLGHRK